MSDLADDTAVTFSGPWTLTTFDPVDAIGLLGIQLEGTDDTDGGWTLQTGIALPTSVTGDLWRLSAFSRVDVQPFWRPFSCLVAKSFSRTRGLTVDLSTPPDVTGPGLPPTRFLRCVSADPDVVVESPPFFDFGIPEV